MNYYRRYIGDYQSDTPHLSIMEHGAYNLLLDFIYGTEKPLPKSKPAIYRICRAFDADEQTAIDNILSQYFNLTDAGYTNNKSLEIIAHDRLRIDAARANGKLGGRPKKNDAGYMCQSGTLYAIRVSEDKIKIGISGKFKARLQKIRKKYHKYECDVMKTTQVADMGESELVLLNAYDGRRSGEELFIPIGKECELYDLMETQRVIVGFQNGNPTPNPEKSSPTPTPALSPKEKKVPNGTIGTSTKIPPCPHQRIISLYHEHLPMMRKVQKFSDARKRALSARWKEYPDIEDWDHYFKGVISKSDFLCGRSQPTNGRRQFIADFDWIINPTNMVNILEGKYHA